MLRAAALTLSDEPLFKTVSDVLRSLGWAQNAPETRGALRDRWESLDTLMTMAEQCPPGTTVSGFVEDLLERQAAQHEPTRDAVTLATLHSAKGLEWDTVYLVGLTEGYLPISYAKTPEAIEEERRLLYVGITRARVALRMTWAAVGPHRASARSRSRFLEDLGTSISDAVPTPVG
jgi:DNA helicase-2/ATP-dependent DNA helicase PcrA